MLEPVSMGPTMFGCGAWLRIVRKVMHAVLGNVGRSVRQTAVISETDAVALAIPLRLVPMTTGVRAMPKSRHVVLGLCTLRER